MVPDEVDDLELVLVLGHVDHEQALMDIDLGRCEADTRPLLGIGQEFREMVGRARQGRVRPEDVEGSTFTVSNLGMFDIDHFIAIINPPEAAILAVGSLRATPVVRDGQLAPGLRLKVTLSADHRVTDGAEAARWLQALRSRLEHPLSLLL